MNPSDARDRTTAVRALMTQRLVDTIKKKWGTYAEASRALNVSPTAMNRYTSGENLPLWIVREVAAMTGTTSDWLLGLTEEDNPAMPRTPMPPSVPKLEKTSVQVNRTTMDELMAAQPDRSFSEIIRIALDTYLMLQRSFTCPKCGCTLLLKTGIHLTVKE